ncbi:hypothetical protein C8J27_10452 [Rhodobacter aestuarii]|uniref:Uncharacterized protein n=1 Tax=Rhodobacter aestuarii TaxID=453582 RepID=A0A1N7L2Q4_9RHOB|nr:hypothetical protein [Rhodobacter aestuarii]PTV95417.1 hypothetical protein C8J27_10452 [Rhodobacter aestuarii]SIS68133.1 hypothetical protein SAMN05421580_103202 [Rhodobacter aestuarii]
MTATAAPSPAEELTQIRAEIARLRLREAELSEIVLRDTALPKIATMHKATLTTRRERVFDPRLLPSEIRLDPAYSREKVRRVLREGPATATDPLEAAEVPARATPRTRFLASL